MNVTEILSKLVSFDVLGGQSNLTIAQWIEDYLSSLDIEFNNLPNEDGSKRCIFCRIGPPVDGGLVLSGHTDVVPVKGQPWNTDPFVLTDGGDGNLYARGSCDMKGFLASCLVAAPEMVKAKLKKPIYFAFSFDEEIGCLMGTPLAEKIMSFYDEKPNFAIIGEPSMMQPIIGHKGIVIYKTTVNGSAGHSSRIRNEVSAIHEASRIILWLENKMNQLIEKGQLDNRFEPPHTSIHCGLFEKSGIAPNVISDSASFYWDIRVIPKDKSSVIKQEFDEYCNALIKINAEKFPDFDIQTVEHHPDVPPLDTPDDLEIVALIRELTGVTKLGSVSYAAEAGQFSNAGFQTVICGPGDIAQAHRANEFISKAQLMEGEEMIRRLVKKFE